MRTLTGFHAIEERIRRGDTSGTLTVLYSKAGPRVKRIIQLCRDSGVPCKEVNAEELDAAVKSLPEALRDHRGVVLLDSGASSEQSNIVDFDQWLAMLPSVTEVASLPMGVRNIKSERLRHCEARSAEATPSHCTVVILDGITDEHNVGAIIRSCDQFGVSLVVLPERRGAGGTGNIADNAVIARASAGAASWVNIAVVKNLTRTVKALKDAGFWVYRADASGKRSDEVDFAPRTALVMGSEGSGVGRLVGENCDQTVAIPTCGRIDSLNVSVAAGILLYEIQRQASSHVQPVVECRRRRCIETTPTGGQ